MTNDIKSRYENEQNAVDLARDALQEALIPRFTVESNRKQNIVRYLIKKRIKRFIDFRESLLERVYPIKLKVANKLIDFGYKQLSRFGRWCPVKLLDGEPVQTLYDEKKNHFLLYTVLTFIFYPRKKLERNSPRIL